MFICMTLMNYSYRFDVKKDGTWENRKTFAYVAAGIPDGKMRNPSVHISPHLVLVKC